MQPIGEKLSSVDYVHQGTEKEFAITFEGADKKNNFVPEQVVVLLKSSDGFYIAATLSKDWTSYDEAVEAGIKAADGFIDLCRDG